MIKDGVELSFDKRIVINVPGYWELDEVMAMDMELAMDAILQFSAELGSTATPIVPGSMESQNWGVGEVYDRGYSIDRDSQAQQVPGLQESYPGLTDATLSMGDLTRKLSADLEALLETNQLMKSATQELNSGMDQVTSAMEI